MILMKEGLELWLRNESGTFMVVLILSPSEIDRTTKEWGCKRGTIHPGNARDFEIVLILLTEVVAFYVRLIPINF